MLYAIGDLHLSLDGEKPMDVFGGRWQNYVERLKIGFSKLTADDVCVLCGDITWGMTLENSLADFKFIDDLPGKKIILKGNHDYWWSTATKAKKFFAENEIETIDILHNNCFFYGDTAICGTRGWFYEEETRGGVHDKKIMEREIGRLETSLKMAGNAEKICFFHYPPLFKDYRCRELIDMLSAYCVKRVYYGHIHSAGHLSALQGVIGGIDYRMVSADWLGFEPLKVM